jgi:acyl-CoA reductase-like NAD-dependent aldehyde dehydrogenase
MRRPWLDPQSLDGPLRGKSPIIVFADTDLKEAARQSTAGIFFNAGQVCSAGSRILVDDGIHDEFVDRPEARNRWSPAICWIRGRRLAR